MCSRLTFAPLVLALGICAACSKQQPDVAPEARPSASSPSPSASASSSVQARVAALPPRQRDGVLFRAIRDAGHDCQEVTDVKQQPPSNGMVGWLVVCDRSDQWLVSLDASGTATVIGAREAAAAQR